MSSRCEIRIRTSSFIDFPQSGLTEEEVIELTKGNLSPKIIEELVNKYRHSKRALRQLKFYIEINKKKATQ